MVSTFYLCPCATVGFKWPFILYVMGPLSICCIKSLPHSEDGEMLHLLYELIHQTLFICSITFPKILCFVLNLVIMFKARTSCLQAYRGEFLHGLKYVLLNWGFFQGQRQSLMYNKINSVNHSSARNTTVLWVTFEK